MNKIQRKTLAVMLAVALLLITTTVVAAKELEGLTISGPGIKGEMSLKDPDFMRNLEQSGFLDQSRLTKIPDNLGEGYNLTIFLNLDGKVVPFMQAVYYPGTESQAGYMNITARMEGDGLQKTDEWTAVSLKGEAAFRKLVGAQGITLQPAVAVAAAKAPVAAAEAASAPKVVEAAAPAAPVIPYTTIAIGGGVVILLLAGLLLRRRSLSQGSTSGAD